MAESCVIIGLGQIGMGYDFRLTDESAIYTHARAIALHPEFRLAGAVDISPRERARFEQCYGVPAFDQIEVALRQLQPNVVVIATPSESHGAILGDVIRACRPKLVLCEKPLSYKLNEARGMVEICEKAGIKLLVNYIRRTDPGVVEIKRRIDSGDINTPVKVNAWYSKGILNNGSHILNLLELWLGDVSSATIIHPGRLWDGCDPEPDVELQFDFGTVVLRAAWEETFSHYGIELLSRSGRLRYDGGGEDIKWQGVCMDPRFNGHRILCDNMENIANGMGIYQWHVYEHIFNYLEGTANTICTGQQALKTIETIDSIIKQI